MARNDHQLLERNTYSGSIEDIYCENIYNAEEGLNNTPQKIFEPEIQSNPPTNAWDNDNPNENGEDNVQFVFLDEDNLMDMHQNTNSSAIMEELSSIRGTLEDLKAKTEGFFNSLKEVLLDLKKGNLTINKTLGKMHVSSKVPQFLPNIPIDSKDLFMALEEDLKDKNRQQELVRVFCVNNWDHFIESIDHWTLFLSCCRRSISSRS